MSALVVGSVALDTVETPFGKRKEALGGSATYFALAACFFTKVNLVAVIGRDFPKAYIRLLEKKRIDTEGLKVEEGKTFRWSGRYGSNLNERKTLGIQLNVFSDFKPAIPENYRSCSHIFLGNIDPQIQGYILDQIEDPRLVACDSMDYWIKLKRSKLKRLLKKRIDIFLANDSETRMFSGRENILKAAKWIISLGPRMVIIKKGEHGAQCFSKDFSFWAPAYLSEAATDPTGCGDAFAGGFMGYLASSPKISDSEIRKAIVYGSIMASFTVEAFSIDRLISLTKREIDKRYKLFKELTRF